MSYAYYRVVEFLILESQYTLLDTGAVCARMLVISVHKGRHGVMSGCDVYCECVGECRVGGECKDPIC